MSIYKNKLKEDAIVDIIEAEYIPPYTIHLCFSDRAEQIIDFEPFIKKSTHPEIKKYLDKDLFKDFSIAHGRLDWNDYDLCFSIEDLYEGTIIKTPLQDSFNKIGNVERIVQDKLQQKSFA